MILAERFGALAAWAPERGGLPEARKVCGQKPIRWASLLDGMIAALGRRARRRRRGAAFEPESRPGKKTRPACDRAGVPVGRDDETTTPRRHRLRALKTFNARAGFLNAR
jgi:hypothetical protein